MSTSPGTARLVILRGLPGSGKSFHARRLVSSLAPGTTSTVVSADDFFTGPDGVYRWSGSKIAEAHRTCFRRFLDAMLDEVGAIVVDNTHVQLEEMQPYIDVGVIGARDIEVHQLTPREDMLQAFIDRCVHGVPGDKVRRRFGQWERMTPEATHSGHVRVVEVELWKQGDSR